MPPSFFVLIRRAGLPLSFVPVASVVIPVPFRADPLTIPAPFRACCFSLAVSPLPVPDWGLLPVPFRAIPAPDAVCCPVRSCSCPRAAASGIAPAAPKHPQKERAGTFRVPALVAEAIDALRGYFASSAAAAFSGRMTTFTRLPSSSTFLAMACTSAAVSARSAGS